MPPPPLPLPPVRLSVSSAAARVAGSAGGRTPPHHTPDRPPGAVSRITPLRSGSGVAAGQPGGPLSGITGAERGQASVEFVVLLPAVAVVLTVAVQALLVGQAAWEARVAARAAARAHALGSNPATAARDHLRAPLERGLIVRASADGDVRVSVRIPTLLPALPLGRASATSYFRAQAG